MRGDGGVRGVQGSGVLIDDSNNVTGVAALTVTGLTTSGTSTVTGLATEQEQISVTSWTH